MLRAFPSTPVKAVICDVYHTLLAVGPGPEDAEAQWQAARGKVRNGARGGSLAAFDAACRAVVAQDHAARRAAGVAWPEVDWLSVARRADPALAELSALELGRFLERHAGLQRQCRAMAGAAEFLEEMRRRGIAVGIASNAQAYTLAELAKAGLSVQGWAEDLCFWSFREGFSKPDPGVFQWLTARLAARGIAPGETLMIGDRLDNDVGPAEAAGWRAWHFEGVWPQL